MGTILDTFNQNVVGSKGRITDYVPLISSSGDFSKITDLQVILNSWTNLLLTPLRSYNHDPEYGSNLFKLVFEPATPQTLTKIKKEVITRITKYDNRATIENVEVQFSRNGKEFTLNVTVDYQNETGVLNTTINSRMYLNLMDSMEA